MDEIIHIKEAINMLKEGVVLKDNFKNIFIYKKKRIYVYSSNSSYNLNIKDFNELFKDNVFTVQDCEDSIIDIEKDKEYYAFKHK